MRISVVQAFALFNQLDIGDNDAVDRTLERLTPEEYQQLEQLSGRLEAAFKRRYASMDVTQRERDAADAARGQ